MLFLTNAANYDLWRCTMNSDPSLPQPDSHGMKINLNTRKAVHIAIDRRFFV